MGISIKPKTDYSSLFQSIGSGSSNLNFLSDYMSIKNGSYGKLMKAYYAKDGASKEVSSAVNKNKEVTSTSKDDAKTLTDIERSAEALNKSANKLMEDEYDDSKDALTAVKDFVGDYNSLLEKAADSNTDSILKKAVSLTNLTASNKNLLSDVGITVGKDNKLSIDEEAFSKAEKSSLNSLFKGTGSYGYSVASQATLIDYQANYESIKASTYTSTGAFGATNSAGSVFEGLF